LAEEIKEVEDVKEQPVKPVKKKEKSLIKSIEELVKEVIKGKHGSGRERMLSLGDDYEAVQHEVNQLIKKGDVE
jgi:hypothetical protein